MTTDSTIYHQTYSYFLAEAQDLLQGMEQDLLSLREDRSPAKVHSLMRAAHTLKGASASVGFESMKAMAHGLEDVFKAFYNPEVAIDYELEALLFEGYECLRIPLTAALSGLECNDAEVLERATSIFSQLQAKLGDDFDPKAAIPSSAELGFDITRSIFETGVRERLEQVATVLAEKNPSTIAHTLQTQAEVFAGLAESMNLAGFGEIAQATLAALKAHPNRVAEIGQAALADLQQGQIAVLNGDRVRGGEPSETLRQLAGWSKVIAKQPSSNQAKSAPRVNNKSLSDSELTRLWCRLVSFLNRPLWVKDPLSSRLMMSTRRKVEVAPTVSKVGSSQQAVANPDEVVVDAPLLEADLEELASSFDTLVAGEATQVGAPGAGFELWDDGWHEAIEPLNSDPTMEDSTSLEVRLCQKDEPLAIDLASSPKETAPHAATIRVALEHLDALNHSTSELLVNQNQQALQDERLQATLQELQDRLKRHQQTIIKLQDWADRSLIVPEKEHRKSFELSAFKTGENHASRGNNVAQNLFDSLELDRHSELHVLLQSALKEVVQIENEAEAIDLIGRGASHLLKKQGRLLTNVRSDLMDVRMVPVGTILNRFPRVLQQLMETHGKSVNLQIQGTQVLVDKAVAEKLYDPLLHLIRNAFDHGIESEEVRYRQGKTSVGQIKIRVYQQGNRTLIEVQDDGGGLDLQKICQRGYELRLLPSDRVEQFSKTELFDLLFEPGFSTADQVSDLSGRGVGLDVVRSSLQSLKGSVTVQSEVGSGTIFSLQLPLTLISARLLVCQVGQEVYGFLSDEVEKILASQSRQVETVAGHRVFHWQQEEGAHPVPIYQLAQLLSYKAALPLANDTTRGLSFPVLDDISPLLLIQGQSGVVAIEVDRIIGEQELVIRPMGTAIAPPSYVYGCSILGDGRLMLVVDGAALASRGLDAGVALEASTARKSQSTHSEAYAKLPEALAPTATAKSVPLTHCILVVDDSITVRQSLALTLESANYRVLQAQDGLEAIAQIQQHKDVQLITCDVEMPRLNGFEFLARYDQEVSSQVPVVMLTSRTSEKHQQLAMQLGASAYLTKPYVEQTLLKTIEDLIVEKAVET